MSRIQVQSAWLRGTIARPRVVFGSRLRRKPRKCDRADVNTINFQPFRDQRLSEEIGNVRPRARLARIPAGEDGNLSELVGRRRFRGHDASWYPFLNAS